MTDENKLTICPEIAATGCFGRTSMFQPTPHLRFVKRDVPVQAGIVRTVTILQQLWADVYSPDKEWRDVPTEEEE